jgi:hypothetical protein
LFPCLVIWDYGKDGLTVDGSADVSKILSREFMEC